MSRWRIQGLAVFRYLLRERSAAAVPAVVSIIMNEAAAAETFEHPRRASLSLLLCSLPTVPAYDDVCFEEIADAG